VTTDDTLAARTAIEQLVTMGHRKIVVIGGHREDSGVANLRYKGCLEAFQKHGIEFDEVLDYESVRFSFEDGYRAARNLLARGREFSAIFAMSDVMAIGAIRALREAGKQVPGDVSVMGFDGLTVGEYTVPTLSTIRQSVEAMAQRSVDILLENIGQARPASYETVPFFVELRESTERK
jgi:LacI family transcriptional regulator